MALPKLLQKLFTNGGAGDKLNQDIIPDIPYSKITGAPSVDSALSSTSENPVQNKAINAALDSKLDIKKPTAGELLLNYGQGGWLTLLGKDFNRADKGGFILATTGPALAGKPDGSLTWGGHNVITVVSESYSANRWYRKYSDGWIEQGGKTTGSSGFTLTFPHAFSNTNYSFVCNTQGNSTGYGYKRSAWISSRTATTVTLGSDAGDPAVWYACGK